MADFTESLIEKVSSYNIFNYLFPGGVFLASYERVSGNDIFSGNVVVDILIAYFAGMVLSRIGSLTVEPFLKWTGFVKFCGYSDFVAAEKVDNKLTTLSQENNTYRTLTAAFMCLVAGKALMCIVSNVPKLDTLLDWAWPAVLMLLFAFAYRKQTAYIVSRVGRLAK